MIKKMRKMDDEGLSPIVATIVLIGIVMALSSVLMVLISGWPQPQPAFDGEFMIENADNGSTGLRVLDVGGTPAINSFDVQNSAITWNNLELKVNGISKDMKCRYATERGETVVNQRDTSETSIDLTPGDEFQIYVKDAIGRSLERGDTITLIYTPKNQVLILATVKPA